MFPVFLVFRFSYKPATTALTVMEHNCEEGGTRGVLNSDGVPLMRKPGEASRAVADDQTEHHTSTKGGLAGGKAEA